MKKLSGIFFAIILGLVLAVGAADSGESNASLPNTAESASAPTEAPPEIKVAPVGRTQNEFDRAKERAERSAAVQSVLRNTKYRLLAFDAVEPENKKDKNKSASLPARFTVVFYDYTNDKTFVATGDFAEREEISVREEKAKPNVSDQELEAAFDLIKADEELGAAYGANNLRMYKAMPPISDVNGERVVNVGVTFPKTGENRVVGASFKNNAVVRYKNGAPPTSVATPEACGIASANQGTTGSGTAGQYQLTATQNGTTLWEMTVVRPSASSGTPSERSGVEVRDVKYKGKSVLKRGHAPVLNVQYDGNFCGPYRDWQYAEGFFNAPSAGAVDPAAGIRVLAPGQVATTALESGVDSGNFRGVAIYTQNVGFGFETVLVSEMEAGWYRYIMEWRFAPDGTIRPRYGFGAVTSSCVCAAHNHHVYWRLDFDVVSPANKIFQTERGRKFMQPVTTETARLRNYGTNRSYTIQNSTSDEAYKLVPGLSDGASDQYGVGDFWFLQYKSVSGAPTEIDDANSGTAANFAPWLNGESLVNQDVVVWYGAHFRHTDGLNLLSPNRDANVLTEGFHVVGPDLRPANW